MVFDDFALGRGPVFPFGFDDREGCFVDFLIMNRPEDSLAVM
jgi:hypothetical protein